MIKHLIHHVNLGQICRITNTELSRVFPSIVDESSVLKFKPILVSSEELLKRFCIKNKYFYQFDDNNNSHLISK